MYTFLLAGEYREAQTDSKHGRIATNATFVPPDQIKRYIIIICTIILCVSVCLSMLANCRSQFLLDCFGRCLKLFVSTVMIVGPSSHEFASQLRLAIIYMQKTPKNFLENRVSCNCLLNETASDPSKRGGKVIHGRSITSGNGNNMSTDK